MNSVSKKELLKTFLIKAVFLYILWQVIYYSFLKNGSNLNDFLTMQVVNGTTLGLKTLGYNANAISNIVYIGNEGVVRIEDVCNGLELFVLYSGFIICFPGRWKPKVAFIVLGCALLFMLNILREIILAFNYHYFRSTFDFNHKYTYTVIVYLFVFLLWKQWLKRYSVVSEKT